MLKIFFDLDADLMIAINHLSGNRILDAIMMGISSWMTWVSIGGIALFYSILKRKEAIVVAILCSIIAISLTDMISFEVVKPLVGRERPCWELQGVRQVLGFCGGSFGFTSNHAANAMAAAMIVIFSDPGAVWVSFAIGSAIMIGFSRVYLGVHYPGDVLGGFFLGALIAIILKKLGVIQLGKRAVEIVLRKKIHSSGL